MRSLCIRGLPDRMRQKVLVRDWPEPEGPAGNEVKTRTIFTGITNGTERNQLIGGNYAPEDEQLPTSGFGYQNVGRVIEVGPDVCELQCGIAGAGIVGQIAAQIATGMGARATLCDIDAKRLELARQNGVAETVLNVSGNQWGKEIADGTFDAVIDLTGVPGMEDQLISSLRQRGRIVFIAGREKVSYTFNLGQGREIQIKQNSHFDRDDLLNTCRLVDQGLVKIAPFIRDVVPVSRAKQIYDTLRDAPNELMGTVFVW